MAIILVADDHPGVAGAVAAMLRQGGHDAAVAHSGPDALAFVRSRPVDLLVLDVSMPGMSGVDVLRKLRADGTMPGLPVVMFSASDHTRDECLRLGAAGFVIKGDADELMDLVTRYAGVPTQRTA